ncbi:MAG TPA: DUF3093 domain-containing protein [Nocardioidaceae bacterium]|nr:DUF3093 domain-containing protein [Nocardioidaceae bacterium]
MRQPTSEPRPDHVEPLWRERLYVPASWWVLGAGMVGTIVWIVWVVAPGAAAFTAGAVAAVVVGAALLRFGSTVVAVQADPDGGLLSAGRGRLPVRVVTDVTALDATELRRQSGVDADARAFLVLPPFVHTAVRVDLADPQDPTPYWLVATRRPHELTAALAGLGRSGANDAGPPPDGMPHTEAVTD